MIKYFSLPLFLCNRETETMIKYFFVLFFFQFSVISQSLSIEATNPNFLQLQPQPNSSFTPNLIVQNVGSCSFTVVITTSCSSTRLTRDQISLAFGDAYGNQVYAPRLNDPSSRAFEKCSSDTFQVNGPCTYQICYAYFYRSGWDGWMPQSVRIYGYNTQAVSFYYNTFIPGDIWYGVNLCGASSGAEGPTQSWFAYITILGCLLTVLL